jgi:amino acid transporter
MGGLGIIPAGIAYYIALNNIRNAVQNPDEYEENINPMNTAKIIALVVLIINALYLLYTVYTIYTFGWDEIMEQSRELMRQIEQNQ